MGAFSHKILASMAAKLLIESEKVVQKRYGPSITISFNYRYKFHEQSFIVSAFSNFLE